MPAGQGHRPSVGVRIKRFQAHIALHVLGIAWLGCLAIAGRSFEISISMITLDRLIESIDLRFKFKAVSSLAECTNPRSIDQAVSEASV